MQPKSGDRVKITTKDEVLEGILMPNEETDAVIVKLDSGYNVGVEKKKVKAMAVLESVKGEKKKEPAVAAKVMAKKNLPTIVILHTGGTIASKVDYRTGGVVARFSADELIAMFPEIGSVANVETKMIASMMSEDMRFGHYQLMIKAIQDTVKECVKKNIKGIILGHGTDTMAYTAAALAFALENLPVPVILVGAQRSSDRGSTDAAMNLLCAAEFIRQTNFAGVAICMHETPNDDACIILPATKTRKMHTSRRDAFKAINAPPIARVSYKERKVEYLQKDYPKADATKPFRAVDRFEERIGLLKSHPHMHPEEILFYHEKKFKGLVVEGTGLGHMPIDIKENLPNYEALKKLIASGCTVVMTSQCIYGRVHGQVYTNLRRLSQIGVIFGEDMLSETAFIKLAWLLGNYKPEEARTLIQQNLRGEINPRLGREFEVFESE